MTHTNRREFLRAAGAAAAGLAGGSALAAAAPRPKRKLNFVFLLIDDMGWSDASCYGSTFYETPGIDRLAAEGMRFTNAYAACPVCSPTRASIMAGKYPARIDLTNFIAGQRRGKLLPAEYIHHLPLEEVTLAEAFKEAGYTTFFTGKWHLGDEPHFPDKQGFTVTRGVGGGSPRSYFSPYKNPHLPDGPAGEYLTDRLTEEAVRFLDTVREEPFLLYLSHHAVHTPLRSKEPLTKKYQAKAAALPAPKSPTFIPEGRMEARQVQDHAVYAGMVQSMDESVARVMKKLDELDLADSTAVIFMSDNGGLSTSEGSPTSNLPLRGGKGWLYEGGIREPMIVKWPGVTKAGSTCDEPVISNDFYPTMLEMASLPLRPKQHVDGVSFASLLTGAPAPAPRALYWHYPHYSNQGCDPGGAVRAGDLKLIENYETGRVELYDLGKDIGERNDLSKTMPAKKAELLAMLHAWRRSVDAKMPKPNPDWKPGMQPYNPARRKKPATPKKK